MFARSNRLVHEIHGLYRRDVAFFRAGKQLLLPAQWALADRAEVRFRPSEGDQFRKGAVVTRTKSGPFCGVESGGEAGDLMMELVSLHLSPPVRVASRFLGVGHGRWTMWTKHQATVTLRQVVALVSLPPEEYAL